MAAPYPQVVLFGDSLLQQSADVRDGFSFQAALQTHCIRRLDVVNRGFSGWTTANAVRYLDRIFPQPNESSPQLKYLVILLGANDAVKPLATTTQHVPMAEYKRNLATILSHPGIRAHRPKILLVTPPPINEMELTRLDTQGEHDECTRSFATSSRYSEAAREVAREQPGVVLIDLWQAIMDEAIAKSGPEDYQAGGPWLGSAENGKAGWLEKLLPDGLHMSGEAYRILFEQVKPYIGPEWAGLAQDDCTGYMLPSWRQLATGGGA
ncbi:hypothetical protein CDD83_6931 [Cordyceps sp. RAO-2017]|nr:hypothetical protein CDD83_6931 [Cordyceps sp. RAO-2017]